MSVIDITDEERQRLWELINAYADRYAERLAAWSQEEAIERDQLLKDACNPLRAALGFDDQREIVEHDGFCDDCWHLWEDHIDGYCVESCPDCEGDGSPGTSMSPAATAISTCESPKCSAIALMCSCGHLRAPVSH